MDFGTDSVRALLTDIQGKELAIAVHEYPRWKNGLYCDAAISQFRQSPLDQIEEYEKIYLRYMESAKLIEQLRR